MVNDPFLSLGAPIICTIDNEKREIWLTFSAEPTVEVPRSVGC